MAKLAHESPDMTLAACGRQLQATFLWPKADCLTTLMRQVGLFVQNNGAGLAGLFQKYYHTSIREHSQERPKVSMRPAPLQSRKLVNGALRHARALLHCRGSRNTALHFHWGDLACHSSCRVVSLGGTRKCACSAEA